MISDHEFECLLEKATDVELENLSRLGSSASLFPSYEIGVAQGCCLSPLLGNILLEDFDRELNGRGIVCIRYIDDFVVLGSDKHNVEAAFKSGLRILARHGLTAYDPKLSTDKAGMGEVRHGFEFLGCSIRPGMISPGGKSRRRVVEVVKTALDRSLVLLNQLELLKRAELPPSSRHACRHS